MVELTPDTHLDHREQAPVSKETWSSGAWVASEEVIPLVEAKTAEVPVTLRKQRVIVERLASEILNPEEEIPR